MKEWDSNMSASGARSGRRHTRYRSDLALLTFLVMLVVAVAG